MTFHVPTCACGHRQGEHKSGRSSWPHPMVYGICLVEGCTCREFVEHQADELRCDSCDVGGPLVYSPPHSAYFCDECFERESDHPREAA